MTTPTATPEAPQVDSLQEARDQIDENEGTFRSGRVKAPKTGKWYTFPNLLLLDVDRQEAYEVLQHHVNGADRHPDTELEVPDRTVKSTEADGTVTETKIKGYKQAQRGDYIEPYQHDGQLMSPPYSVQLAAILLGDDWEEFKAAGGRPSEVLFELQELRKEAETRVAEDPK